MRTRPSSDRHCTRPRRGLRAPAALLTLLLFPGTSCTQGPDEPSSSPTPPGASSSPSPSPTSDPDPSCAPRPGRDVEPQPDVTIPAVEVAPILDADGEELAPAFTVPAQVVDGGCVIRYDAPGGCLGAVEITGASIPPAVIPETVIGERVYPEVVIPGASRPGARAEQACRIEQDGELVGVTRAGVVREGFSRNGGARPGDDLVSTVRLDAVRMADVDIEPERLESRTIAGRGDLSVLTGEKTTSYVAPAGVLFDLEEAALRPEAVAALRTIALRVRAADPGRRILVEGHTDDLGDEAYGMQLSKDRAHTVANWLIRQAGFDADSISTRGFGETQPAYPNNSDANRARNRRVVITVVW